MLKLRWIIAYAILSFIAAVTVVTFLKEAGRIDRLSSSLEDRMAELVELTRKNQTIQEKISYYKTPEGIAHLAREEFNLVRPGEKMYRMEIISGDKQVD